MLISSLHSRFFFKKGPARRSFSRGGFTLLELMVVVGIISILATVVFTQVTSVRVKARDTQRLKDLETMQAAVEQYYRDYGHYPIVGSGIYASFDSEVYKCNPIVSPDAPDLSTALAPYITKPLKDPKVKVWPNCSGGHDAGYLYTSNAQGTRYCIMVWRTPEDLRNFPQDMINMSLPNRCGAVDSNGKCTNLRAENIYVSSDGVGC